MKKQIKILIIEDNEDISDNLVSFVSPFAETEQAFDGTLGLLEAQRNIYDLIILDIMLPGQSGYDVLKKLREDKISIPILMLTAKDQLNDKVHGFELGADDYLTKPFHGEELVMRIKALLKRGGSLNDDSMLTFENISINISSREVTIDEQVVDLNGKEFDLLVYLIQNNNTILTKEQIFERIWDFDSDTSITVIEVYMSNLRKKLHKYIDKDLIKTIRNVGYIFQGEK
ncbi:DNA-binding response regulator [Companilactobacillus sp. RD055328]|uniref:response regulator transcription factor n=1 Tax=Companilactobacillus sp. RD055328 TaxID=2916634 RepID=UPI001FC80133|nr:response regulator transcription factor [Companilactobacillus sp. RD055328]GKQ43184.1 DNA-binding response regulator [Companilactobacillus sp. RD055328]